MLNVKKVLSIFTLGSMLVFAFLTMAHSDTIPFSLSSDNTGHLVAMMEDDADNSGDETMVEEEEGEYTDDETMMDEEDSTYSDEDTMMDDQEAEEEEYQETEEEGHQSE